MSARIECNIDVASLYSYIAYVDLMGNLDKLRSHGVEVEFHPILIAGINKLSGNKPPWLLPAKAKYIDSDVRRAASRLGMPAPVTPDSFLETRSFTASPQRAMLYVKANYPARTFHAVLARLFSAMWIPPHVNVCSDEGLARVLAEAVASDGEPVFTDHDVRAVLDGRAGLKDSLASQTNKAVDQGAFGAPWFWVTNAKGETDGFFGSDR
ncbi:DSBA-like thioredoxin domain [Geosmithia morbida]|uniref:DSBA-like thioredoxin domain n=1 Tax=Geosmithia morbida TaxID=1094350 RepID=A0A9P4YT19_9HYPO|nr:DSBA-like thioredoxin domain [Geosmithia morbida]KAF4121198.1 DSBA-like thioredoxin domain [Geosmithia morbida]